MNLFKTIKLAIYSPQFYAGISKKTFKQAVGYFLLLSLFLTIIHLITLISPLFIEAPTQVRLFVQEVVDCYPKDLEIKITNGQTAINREEPYFISGCGKTADQKLAVIDTKTPFSADKFNDYKAVAWVTKNAVFYKKDHVETRSYSLTQVKDFKLNQDTLRSYSNMISPWFNLVGPALLLLALVGIYLTYIFRLIYIAFLALIIWGMGKIFKQILTYGESYKISLYAITLGLIVELIIGLTSRWTHLYAFPFMVTIITLGVVWMNLIWAKRT